MMRQKIATVLMFAAVFLLPWQTRFIYASLTIGGEPWEYGVLSLYAVEVFVVLAAALRGRPHLSAALTSFPKHLLFLLGTLAMATSFSLRLPLALGVGLHVVAAVVFLLVLVDERTPLRAVAWTFCAGLVVPAALGWMQVMTGSSPASTPLGLAFQDAARAGVCVVELPVGRLLRAYGSFPHPNIFGGYLAVSLVILGWLAWTGKRRDQVLATVLASVFVPTLVVTFSRSAWLGLVAATMTLLVWMFIHKTRPTRASLFVLIPVVAGVVTCVTFASAIFVRFDASSRLETKSLVEREESLKGFPSVFRVNPFTGVGPGNYTQQLTNQNSQQSIWFYQPVHNAFLLFLAELGILGVVGLVRLVYFTAQNVRPVLCRNPWPVVLLAVLLPPAFFDHYLWSLWPGLVLTVLCSAFVLHAQQKET
jgi:O-antigen ligase